MAYTTELFANNARTTTAGSLTAIATSIVLQTGAGALFPSPNNLIGEFAKATLQDTATGLRNEIVYITARVGDVLTVVRGQDGTSAQAWIAGDTVFGGVTAGTLGSFVQPVSVQNGSYIYAEAAGSTTAYTATFAPAIATLTEGMTLWIDNTTVGTNTTSTPTFSPNGLTAHTIVRPNGGALLIGDIPTFAQLVYDLVHTRWILVNPNADIANERLLLTLDYPTINNSTNTLTVTPAIVAGQGGNVSIAAGTLIELGKALDSNYGVMRQAVTAAFTSPTLTVSSTYYLRAQWSGDTLTVYVQKGTDTDATPAGLVGTVNGASGGGFDSTTLDILLAKIVTSTAGTTPTVTALKNKKLLYATSSRSDGPSSSFTSAISLTINWGRTPNASNIDCADVTGLPVNQFGSSRSVTLSRYTASVAATYSGTTVTAVMRINVEAK